MQDKARKIVAKWIGEHCIAEGQTYQIFLVWSSKVLQNYKCTLFTTLPNSPYFELTYNGDKDEWYLDVYAKTENNVIKNSEA